MAPEDHINGRIVHPGSSAQDKGDPETRGFVVSLCLYTVCTIYHIYHILYHFNFMSLMFMRSVGPPTQQGLQSPGGRSWAHDAAVAR